MMLEAEQRAGAEGWTPLSSVPACSSPRTWFLTQVVFANCNDREKLECQGEQNLCFILDQMFLKNKSPPDLNFDFNSIDW